MQHNKIAFTRMYCRQRKVPYQIKDNGTTMPLFIGHGRERKQVCYSLLNLEIDQIATMIDSECIYDEQGNYAGLAFL